MNSCRTAMLQILTVLPALSYATAAQSSEVSQEEAAPQAQRSTGIGEIVVTAQRREENLQEVPISLTALSSEDIEVNRIQNVADLANIAPNTTVRLQPGGNQIPQFTIRGVAAGASTPGSDNGVSLYVDGVYIGRTFGATFDVADLERIEVLRGPQGTLFGRNSTGGAISLITGKPKGEFALRQDVSLGNYDLRRLRTRLDTPEWNGLSASLTYLHLERDGDVRNLGGGTTWDFSAATGGRIGPFTAARTLGAVNSDAVNAAVRFNSGDFETIYRFDYTNGNGSGPATAVAALGPAASGGGLAELILSTQTNGVEYFHQKRPDEVNNWFSSRTRQRVQGHSLTTTYDISDAVSLKNISAYRKSFTTSINQIDGAGGVVVQPSFNFLCGGAACEGDPFLLLAIASRERYWQLSSETHVSLTSDSIDAIGGFLYFKDKTRTGGPFTQQVFIFSAAPGFNVPGSPMEPNVFRSNSKALFGQVTFHATDKLDLVGGLRQTWDHKAATDFTVPGAPDFSRRTNRMTYLANISYRPNPDVNLYAKVASGFISGGQQGGFPYEPETAVSYEAGMKADLFDRRLRTNIAVFKADYSNLQFPTFVNGVIRTNNAGESRAYGFEFEATAAPVDGLTFNAGVGYTNFKYTELDPSIGTLENYKPIYRPKLTTTLAVDYSLPEFSWGGQLRLHGDTNYNSGYRAAPSVSGDAVRLTRAPATWLFNGRVSLVGIPLMSSEAEISLWGKNLTNRKQVTFVSDLGFLYSANYQDARTYGIDMTVSF